MLFFSVRVNGKRFISIGSNTIVQRGGWLLASKILYTNPELVIGERCAIGDYCHITAINSVVLENDVLLANHVYISDNTHDFSDINFPIQEQPIKFKRAVRLKSGCWIGENACIIGASIGKNSVVGANSVVLKDVEDYCVVAGNPAKIVKKFDHKLNLWIKP